MALKASVIAGSNNGSAVTTTPIDTTGSNFIFIATALVNSALAPTDSFGNSYTLLRTAISEFGPYLSFWYKFNPIIGPGHVFSVFGFAINPSIAVAAFDSVVENPLDGQNSATPNTPALTAQTGSVNPSQNDDLFISAAATNAGTASAIDSGFSITGSVGFGSSVCLGLSVAYLEQGTGASLNPTWTNGSAGMVAAGLFAFKTSSTPPPPPPPGPPTPPPPIPPAPPTPPPPPVPPPPFVAGQNAFRWQIEAPGRPGRWFAHSYSTQIATHYAVEASANDPNDQQLFLLGLGIFESGGNSDNGSPVLSSLQLPANDGGDERLQKLYPDALVQADGTGSLSVTPAFDNGQVFAAPTIVSCAGTIQQFQVNIASLANLALHRNIGAVLSWAGGPGGPRIYAWEPAAYIQPYLSTFLVTQFINLSYPGWKMHRRLYPALISTSPVIFTIKCQDGRTFTYVIPSTNGQFLVLPMITDHGIKDLAFAYELDGQGKAFALFPDAFTLETKGWPDPEYLELAIFKT